MGIICLANSYKHQGRCIAGIDEQSGKWVRPISSLDDGRIPLNNKFIKAERISILDIVNVPLAHNIKAGHEVENVGYQNLPWQVTGRAQPANLLRYCDHSLLYPEYGKAIPYDYLEQRAPIRTLQLIEAESLSFHKNSRDKWRAVIADEKYGLADFELSITDPIALEKLNQGKLFSYHCLLSMSLAQPWHPDSSSKLLCYRLIAGVIEFPPELKMILTQMNRVSWSIERGRKYLQENFGKKSRYQLTEAEAKQFLNHLRNLGTTNT